MNLYTLPHVVLGSGVGVSAQIADAKTTTADATWKYGLLLNVVTMYVIVFSIQVFSLIIEFYLQRIELLIFLFEL